MEYGGRIESWGHGTAPDLGTTQSRFDHGIKRRQVLKASPRSNIQTRASTVDNVARGRRGLPTLQIDDHPGPNECQRNTSIGRTTARPFHPSQCPGNARLGS